MKLNLKTPCSFYSSDSPIRILDDKKKLFFYHPNSTGEITFNLPVGIYYTDNELTQRNFKPYVAFIKPENYISPTEFKIIIGKNEHKATISINNRTILLDKSIAKHDYKPCVVFVLLHELYHTVIGGNVVHDNKIIFNAEQSCDDFATNYMLSHGYNPTQIKLATQLILNDEHRKKCVHEKTVSQNFRY